MRLPWSKRPDRAAEARRRQVTAQAEANLRQLRVDGQPEAYLRTLEPFVALAPEVLALGPAPASLTMRVLYGLATFEGEARARFLATMREEFTSSSPTLRAVRRDGLVALAPDGTPALTAAGRRLYERLARAGAFATSAHP